MSIPTSLIVVLLVVAWLVVLVPMVARRRERVPQSEAESSGSGFRELRRASASLRRRPVRRPKGSSVNSEDSPAVAKTVSQTTTTDGFAGGNVIDAPTEMLVGVGAGTGQEPHDAAEEWAAAQATARTGAGSHPAFPARPEAEQLEGADVVDEEHGARVIAGGAPDDGPSADGSWASQAPTRIAPDYEGPQVAADLAAGAEQDQPARDRAESERVPDEFDEQEWSDHAAAAPSGATFSDVDDEHLRPVPHRRGRGGFDPEAAEVTRAYKYQQRRRVTLILVLATVVCTLVAVFLVNWLWVGAVVSLALLVGYLAYLRRQVRIEASIRQRRMERLQRARQIRPESARPPHRARVGASAAGPGRTVVDLDDDDPSFDHLDEYQQPMTYRRAAGQ